MWKCHKCGKPVYFAERKQSLGYDWHPECLRCEECGKRLNPGQHAEHKGVPYCHVPCYGALFGPQLYGHGTRVESHTSFGKVENKSASKNVPRSHLESKLKVFNQYYDGRSGEIRRREVNGRLVLEGAVRIHWGVSGVIHLKEDVDQRTLVTLRKRNSCRYSRINPPFTTDKGDVENGDNCEVEHEAGGEVQVPRSPGVDPEPHNLTGKSLTLPSPLHLSKLQWNQLDDLLQVERIVNDGDSMYHTMPSVLPSSASSTGVNLEEPKENGDDYSRNFEDTLELGLDRSQSNPEALGDAGGGGSDNDSEADTRSEARAVRRRAPVMRRPGGGRARRRLNRRCSINGHFYNRETSFFRPPYGSQMSVWVTSLVSTPEVINLILDKYKVDSSPHCFALYIVRDNGEQRIVQDEEYPLITRVMLGPHEDVARLYLMDRGSTVEISSEVAQFLNLSLAECKAILDKFKTEEDREQRRIVTKYKEMRKRIKQRMEELKVHL